ncbi:MAG TPA: hypothetical protein VG267_18110 [Terracidiphilus sp.]|jgi:hypothetical protein|nr:hypothetical protein [Terracidiphilus sp.]
MKQLGKWMLGAAVAAGALGLGATQAKAAEFGVYVRGPVAYVPPCPGPGYSWIAGYYANGYWMPGRWSFVGVRGGWDRDGYRDGRVFNRDRDRDRDRDRGGERYRR